MKDSDKIMDRLLADSGNRFEGIELEGIRIEPRTIIETLGPVLTPERRARIDRVVSHRTYGVATVVEGLANTGNVSAVMRTAEGLGFQSFHTVAGDAELKHSKRTTQGAHKWLDVEQWNDPARCCAALRDRGYRILAAHLDDDALPVSSVDFTRPTAVVFGNELMGVSASMLREVECTCRLPTPGFVQSYNISVAAAMVLHRAHEQRTERLGRNGDLSESDQERLRADFFVRSIRSAEAILRRKLLGSDGD